MPSVPSLHLQAALDYLRMGWYPIPLCWPDEEGNCGCGRGHGRRGRHNEDTGDAGKEIGKAPLLGGYLELRPTAADIVKWWTRWPEANIGILLEPSGLVVIDLDSDGALNLVEQLGYPTCPQVARNGQVKHLYFLRGDAPAIRVIKPASLPGIDILAGGYVVAPPSRHKDGGRYEWVR